MTTDKGTPSNAKPRFAREAAGLNLPELEEQVLAGWQKDELPKAVLSRNDQPAYVFYEGPPTANGRPGIHHVLSRTLKDIVCRFWSMNGYSVPRKAGWDTHGLPVEIEVQKELDIEIKPEIENYGIGPFNTRCKDSVFRYRQDWEKLSDRMGYWLDYDNPYVTCANQYISSVWSILSRFFQAGLLEKGSRVLPYCPQCGTGLSSHEVAQGYQTVRDPSVFIRFPRRDHPGESFLVWTTTPWTLPSNVALAVHPDLTYVRVRREDGEVLILAETLVEKVFRKEKVEVLDSMTGQALADSRYERPFDLLELSDDQGQRVVTAEYVSADDGTGIVHIAPAFGVDDHQVGQEHGFAELNPVTAEGTFDDRMGKWAGQRTLEANQDLCRDLKERGRLFRKEQVEHSYPHCWRCKTPLLYWLRPSWYIRTTRLREQLVERNSDIDWFPPEIGQGRFGEWLKNNVDWAVSRERYWGTPLNLWICETCEDIQAVDHEQDLRRRRPDLPEDFDLHRPFIDEITLPCSVDGCNGTARRTPEVIDCWFDSGSMPFAQQGWLATEETEPPALFPADYIAEGLDQTRGWFYTLHVISVFLTGKPAYRRCLVNDLILDEKRQKMSKSRGNTVDPWKEIHAHGVDAIRWYLIGQSNPWLPKVYDGRAVATSSRDFLGTLWSCYSFFVTYADIDGFDPDVSAAPDFAKRPEMDRWILAELQRCIADVRSAMERYDLTRATQFLTEFVDRKLSNWYVRRSRSRFWGKAQTEDKQSGFQTLFEVLDQVAVLLAPFVPFFAEALHRRLRPESRSVHLCDYPRPREDSRDAKLESSMAAVLRVVGLGRRARSSQNINNRQPLACLYVKGPDGATDEVLRGRFGELVADELNVQELRVATDEIRELRTLRAKPNFKALGPKLGKNMGAAKKAIEALSEADLEKFLGEPRLTLTLNGEQIELGEGELEVLLQGKDGYGVESDGQYLVALNTTLTPELIEQGLVRELVKRINNSRREAGLQVEDRVALQLVCSGELAAAALKYAEQIQEETLARSLDVGPEVAAESDEFQRFDWDVGEASVGVLVKVADGSTES